MQFEQSLPDKAAYLPFSQRCCALRRRNEAAKQLLAEGAIGRVSAADAVLAHRGPKHAPWFFDREKAGWGVSADLGIYLISQLTYFFGPAQRVCGRVETVFPERKNRSAD